MPLVTLQSVCQTSLRRIYDLYGRYFLIYAMKPTAGKLKTDLVYYFQVLGLTITLNLHF